MRNHLRRLLPVSGLVPVLIVLLVFSGCANAVWDETPPAASSGLRLLAGGSGNETLSDLQANDWAPNMVRITGADATNRWLYFLSDRQFQGKTNTVGLFRAMELKTGVFTNLQLVWQTNGMIDNLLVTRNHAAGTEPLTLVEFNENGQQVFYQLVYNANFNGFLLQPVAVSSLDNSVDSVYLAGRIFASQFGTDVIFIRSSHYSWSGEGVYPLIDYNGVPVEVPQFNQMITNVTPFPLGLLLQKILGFSGRIDGVSPVVMPMPGDPGRKVLALTVSLNGRLAFVYNSNLTSIQDWFSKAVPPVEFLSNRYFQSDRVLQLGMLDHPPGSRDITPHADPESGLYFASDRNGGKHNLYFVPWQDLFAAGVPAEEGGSASAVSSSDSASSFSISSDSSSSLSISSDSASSVSSAVSVAEPFTNGQQAMMSETVAVPALPAGHLYWLAVDGTVVGSVSSFQAGSDSSMLDTPGAEQMSAPAVSGTYFLYLVENFQNTVVWKSSNSLSVY